MPLLRCGALKLPSDPQCSLVPLLQLMNSESNFIRSCPVAHITSRRASLSLGRPVSVSISIENEPQNRWGALRSKPCRDPWIQYPCYSTWALTTARLPIPRPSRRRWLGRGTGRAGWHAWQPLVPVEISLKRHRRRQHHRRQPRGRRGGRTCRDERRRRHEARATAVSCFHG